MLLSQVPSFSSLLIELYIPKYFFTHAASLHQSFLHCAIFPTAASRRSLGRVSVPMWPYILSDRLLIVALVGRYPANWLIRRGPSCTGLLLFPMHHAVLAYAVLAAVSSCCPPVQQVTHALLTRPPLSFSRRKNFVRLACVKHAASVYPEPGSNSHVQFSVQFCANAFLSVCVSYLKDFTVFIGCSLYYAKNFTRLTTFVDPAFLRNLQGWLYCSIIKVLCDFFFAVSSTAHLIYHSRLHLSSTFQLFSIHCF